MKVETSTVTKLVISDVPRLDPISVFLEDFGRRDCPTEKDPNYQTAQERSPLAAGTRAGMPTGVAWVRARLPSSSPTAMPATC